MAHNTAGDRTQRHDHYLKGTLYCGSCGSRPVISNAKSRSGDIYPYFVCAGRHRKRTGCTRSAVLLDDAERLVIDYYQHNIQIPAHDREQLRGMPAAEFDQLLASSEANWPTAGTRSKPSRPSSTTPTTPKPSPCPRSSASRTASEAS